MSVKDLIKSAIEKDASSFETSFDAVMGEKVESAIAAKYDEMFSTKPVEEELELDEEELELDEEADEDEDEDEEDEDEDDDDEDDEDEEDED